MNYFQKKDDDHVFIDLSQKYEDQDDVDSYGAPIRINKNFTIPIIDRPSDYHMIIERFFVPSYSTPAYIFDPDLPGVVNLTYNGITEKQPLINTFVLPKNSLGFQNFLYLVQDWIVLVNTAYETCLNTLKASAGAPAAATAPYFKLNPTTGLISLYAEEAYYDQNIALPIQVGADIIVQKQIMFLKADFTLTQSYVYSLNKYPHTFEIESIGGVNYIVQTQEGTSSFAFNPIQKILILSNTIPVRAQFTQLNSSSTDEQSGTNSLNILQDFKVNSENAIGETRKGITYVPNKRIPLDLVNETPLKQMDLAVYFTDVNNNLYPITLLRGEQFDIKISFSRIGSMPSN
jgi:hypothetical protein